ncbi:hypothetical protein GJ496_009133 [Pomphorhynchus laevis]|nr:hypothetical protein GJ496_009133 [Pomphorhynchus laevis]
MEKCRQNELTLNNKTKERSETNAGNFEQKTFNRCASDTDIEKFEHPSTIQCQLRYHVAGLSISSGRRCASTERLNGGMDFDDALRFNTLSSKFIKELKLITKVSKSIPIQSSSIPSQCSSLINQQVIQFPNAAQDTVKKAVRFADAHGLELVHVHYFERSNDNIISQNTENVPQSNPFRRSSLPPYVYLSGSRDAKNNKHEDSLNFKSSSNRHFVAAFQMPRFLSNYKEKLNRQNVILESVSAFEGNVAGIVTVMELGYTQKQVFIRESHDEWKTFTDHNTVYIYDSFDGIFSKFSFTIYIQPLNGRGTYISSLQFAICYKIGENEYWDNNDGHNYVFLVPFVPDLYVRIPTSRK